ncbi:MAG TPA: methyltransferase domain-containing protein [Candidatus Krumholzibacteria bacterium]|nr:methyltransferase domain-containing protein [Candidatus Krumholzibacteria bacterium]HRX50775.1 methyltransferase domain-containing protein [Candidatus Krumholzibacteria bacterium]
MSEPTDWQEVLELAKASAGGLLDIRPAAAAADGHLPGAAGLPVPEGADPAEFLPVYLLPPRHAPLLVLADSPVEAERVAAWLRERGRPLVRGAAPDWTTAPPGVLEAGVPMARLWRPPTWLEEHVGLLPPPDAHPVTDLGCGSGRAAAWLCGRGYRVLAVDRHADALDWARRLAAGAPGELVTVESDLTVAAPPPGPWSAALAFRFLHRPLVADLADRVRPGGVAMLRTFRWEKGDWSLPRRRYCLQPGELEVLFPRADWEILALREDHDEDGKPASGVVARRR